MFDELLGELRKLERGVQMSFDVPPDADGYFDRSCPSLSCGADFKIHLEDWRSHVRDEQVHCPICRHEADSSAWNTREQIEFATQAGNAQIESSIADALKRDARRFNATDRNGFIDLTMQVRSASRPTVTAPEAAEVMQQRFACEKCGCRYASVGAAFFCPACGHNSAASTFTRTIEVVTNTLAAVPRIKASITDTAGKDAAHDAVRQLLEDQFSRLVGAFERLAEALFERLPHAAQIKLPKGVFQKLVESSALWKAATGNAYEDILATSELADLYRLFQQRHVLGHRQGIVDQTYIDRSGDTAYVVGQRLVIREASVHRLAQLVAKLAEGLRALVS